MPFGSYQGSAQDAVDNAVSFIKAGMNAVKVEGGGWVVETVAQIVSRGIPVMGHLGLTPQSVNAFGGMRVQARSDAARQRLLEDAEALEEAGAFAVVLEGIPRDLAATVTDTIGIPTIGIGAGPDCDGQVLVWQDMLGLRTGKAPRFVKRYADLHQVMLDAARAYSRDVQAGEFPGPEHAFES
jgi:3-methyl-2-oxobutanoate hydroxymethyltransferase